MKYSEFCKLKMDTNNVTQEHDWSYEVLELLYYSSKYFLLEYALQNIKFHTTKLKIIFWTFFSSSNFPTIYGEQHDKKENFT